MNLPTRRRREMDRLLCGICLRVRGELLLRRLSSSGDRSIVWGEHGDVVYMLGQSTTRVSRRDGALLRDTQMLANSIVNPEGMPIST